MIKFDLKKGLVLLLLIFAATTYSQDNTIRLTSNGVAIGGLNPDEGSAMAQDDTVLTFDSAGVTTVNAADPDYTLGSNTGAVTFADALSKSITVRLKAGLVIDQTLGSTYGAITTTGGIDRAGDGAIGVRPATGTLNYGIENGEGITFGFSASNLPTTVTLQITRIYFSTFGAAENGVIVNRRDTSKKLDFAGPASGTNIIIDASSLDLFVRGGSTLYDMVSIFNNSSTAQSWRVTNIEFKLVETNSLTTVWNGSVWSAFTPGPAMDAVIQGNYSALASGGFSAKKLTINSGTLSIEATKAVKVDNELINNAGPTGVVVFSGGGLRQVNNTVNTGAITVKRISNPLSRLDSKAWSSPIANQNLLSFSPATLSTNFLNYNEGTNQFVSEASPSTTDFSTAGGYLIGMPDDAVTAPLTQTFEGNFIGITNNGDITKAITYGSSSSLGYNLVGNPYPSAIIANSFINANIANIDGSIYFYRKTSSSAGSAYAMYSRLGATNLVASSADTNAEISVGEGFIVKAKNNANLTFTNAMRIASVPATLTADRVWLNLTNTAGVFSQALVGYVADGTLGVDNYDGKYINDSPVALTSSVNSEEYTIQGRPAFTPSDEVGLNFKTDQTGSYTIGVDRFDGVFTAGQEIYLKDNTTGTFTDLRTNSYTFTASAGTDNSRFVLRYRAASYPIAATAGDNGSVSGVGTYDTSSTATLIATPSAGYGFVKWTENSVQVSANPTYTFTVTGARTLVANFGFTNVTDVTACNSYTWNGIEYTASGVYIGNTIDGVVQKLNLTITPSTTTGSETVSACGASYTWTTSGVAYTSSGTYTYVVGCNTATLNLTLTPKPEAVTTNATICSGESYNWSANSTNYTTTQTVTITNDGCIADQVLNLTVTPKPTTVTTNVTICSGESYNWSANGQAYTTAQTALTITNDACTADQVLNLTVIPAANAGANGTLSLSSSPSDADLFAALTGADAGGSWTRPSSGFVGVYTYTVNAISPCTVNATSTVTVSSATVLPAADTTFDFCTGAKVSALIAATGTGVKAYAAATGGVALLDVALKGTVALPVAYFLSEPTLNGGESARVRVYVKINALPATPSVLVLTNENAVLPATSTTAVTAVGVFVGTNTPFKLTATAVGAVSYKWTLPTGVVRTDATGSSTDNSKTSVDGFIYVKFSPYSSTTPLPLVINVQSVNASGCTSAVKASASLTRLLPTAPTAIKMTDALLPLPTTGIATSVTSFAKYMGTNTVLTLTATPSLTAISYVWELPAGVTQLSGGTSNVITVNFAGVTNSNTVNYLDAKGISTNALRIGVKSVNGVGVSTTSNSALSNPPTDSTYKLLTLTAVAPAAPTALVLNDPTEVVLDLAKPKAVTIISKFIGQGGTYRLVAAVPATTIATSFAWDLPACVTRVTSLTDSAIATGTTTVPYIFVKFTQDATASPGSIYFGVKAVNGVGSSNSSVANATVVGEYANSTFKLLKLATAVPAAPATLVLNDVNNGPSTTAVTVLGKYIGKTTKLKLNAGISALANTYSWTLPTGVNRVDESGASIESTTSTESSIFVNFANVPHEAATISLVFGVKAVNSVGSSLSVNAAPNATRTDKLLTVTAGVPVKVAAISGSLTVCNRTEGFSYIITAPVGANKYVITAPLGSVVSSLSVPDNASNVLTTSDLTFKVVYDGITPFSTIDKYLLITSVNDFGNSTIGFKSAALTKQADCASLVTTQRLAAASVTEVFKVLAYPNPYTSDFQLDFTTASESKVELRVYDMIGKLLEVRQMNSDQVNTQRVGNNYPSGIYNVIVTQDANVKTLRVIKK